MSFQVAQFLLSSTAVHLPLYVVDLEFVCFACFADHSSGGFCGVLALSEGWGGSRFNNTGPVVPEVSGCSFGAQSAASLLVGEVVVGVIASGAPVLAELGYVMEITFDF